MLGAFLSWVLMAVANPIMYHVGMLPSWDTADETIMTQFHCYMDFYFSFGLGVSFAVAIVGLIQTGRSLLKHRASQRAREAAGEIFDRGMDVPEGRGDIRTRWVLITYLSTSLAYILLSGYLIDWDPGVMLVLVLLAYAYVPLISYITARLEGMAGQMVNIPFVTEAAFILSGYQGGVKVWFLPIPVENYGQRTVFYRQAELTGTKFWSIWKSEIVTVPIVLIATILFAQFIWSLAPIPGPQYPFAEKMWELNAATWSVIVSSTLGRHSAFQEAFNPMYIATGVGLGLVMFGALRLLMMPTMIFYGIVRGMNQIVLPHVVPVQFLGACIGKFYFERRMGLTWRQYIPVIAAGFSCGMGLVTVLSVGVNFLAKSVIKIPF
jgi:hypothetical protein